MNILLLNGHGGKPWDCGAKGCGYEEADLTRECTDRVEKGLKKYAKVYRYPSERNAFQDIENGLFANILSQNFRDVKFDYAFERHFNAYNGSAHGTECFVTSTEQAITVEQTIMKRMGKYFTLRDNDSIFDGVKRTNFLVIQTLKNMGISGALLETCFIDNPLDMKVWSANKTAIDNDVVAGLIEGFGLGEVYTMDKPKPAPIPSSDPKPATKYKVGTIVCTNILATSSDGGKIYKGDWKGTITKVYPGRPYPYLLDKDTGFTNDNGIDSDSHVPGGTSTPKPKMTAKQFALEVWNQGKHGTGEARKAEAQKLDVDYNEAQKLINILASGGKI